MRLMAVCLVLLVAAAGLVRSCSDLADGFDAAVEARIERIEEQTHDH